MKTIVLTGGGSGGHIAPIRAVAPELKKNYKLVWIGASPFEENAARELDIPFKKIASGKFRRGKSARDFARNARDLFRVSFAVLQSLILLKKYRPEKVFSTGGFVSVPVVLAARILGIPVVVHEQTIGFGLANKIALPSAEKILLAFEDSKKYIPKKYHAKVEVVGNPIREALLGGTREGLEKVLGVSLDTQKPILYITGGGQGSQLINGVIFENLDWLTERFIVIHQAGKSGITRAQNLKMKTSIRANASFEGGENKNKQEERDDYFPFSFVEDELADIYVNADVVIARAGAGTVNELDYFGIPSIFVPLRPTQNDEQTKNAEWFLRKNNSLSLRGVERSEATKQSHINNDSVIASEAKQSQSEKPFALIIPQNEFNTQTLKDALKKIQIKQHTKNQKSSQTKNQARELILKNL